MPHGQRLYTVNHSYWVRTGQSGSCGFGCFFSKLRMLEPAFPPHPVCYPLGPLMHLLTPPGALWMGVAAEPAGSSAPGGSRWPGP